MRRFYYWLIVMFLIASGSLSRPAEAQRQSMPKKVSLTNLYDAFGKEIPGVAQDFGFSALIRYGDKTILFDAGTNANIFEKNVKALKADLRKVDIVIISHGHYDHIGGMDHLLAVNPKVKIYLPRDFVSIGAPSTFPFREPEPLLPGSLPADEQYFRGASAVDGRIVEPTGRFWRFDHEYVTEPKEVLPGVTLIPTTSSLMGSFAKYPPFEDDPRLVGMPELSVSFSTDKGQMIVSGCSHSSIEKIVQRTLVVKKEKIRLITGGFHLIPYRRDHIESLAKRMRNEFDVEYVAPAHCSGQNAFSIFRKVFGEDYRSFGLGQTLSF